MAVRGSIETAGDLFPAEKLFNVISVETVVFVSLLEKQVALEITFLNLDDIVQAANYAS